MKRSQTPSITALKAFESAARHGGIARASEELSLSQSAVSRLVKQVEDALGVQLFLRQRQRIILTNAGQVYAKRIGKIFEDLEQSSLHVMTYGGNKFTHTINLGVLSTLAMSWLIPRLPEFYRKHGNIVVSCYSRPKPIRFEDDPLDAAIHYGQASWPNATVRKLFEEDVVTIASPKLSGLDLILEPRDLARYPLLHEATRPDEWMNWFLSVGLTSDVNLSGARFDHFALVKSATIAGLGIGLVPKMFVTEELENGTLVNPIAHSFTPTGAYYIAYPQEGSGNPVLEDFINWLLSESKSYQQIK